MKQFEIKHETYTGKVKVVTKTGYDEQHAKNQLVNCREVYWCKKKKKEQKEFPSTNY